MTKIEALQGREYAMEPSTTTDRIAAAIVI